MDALEAILTRRSVRRYTDEQIDAETTQKLLEAAMNAPSAANSSPGSSLLSGTGKGSMLFRRLARLRAW